MYLFGLKSSFKERNKPCVLHCREFFNGTVTPQFSLPIVLFVKYFSGIFCVIDLQRDDSASPSTSSSSISSSSVPLPSHSTSRSSPTEHHTDEVIQKRSNQGMPSSSSSSSACTSSSSSSSSASSSSSSSSSSTSASSSSSSSFPSSPSDVLRENIEDLKLAAEFLLGTHGSHDDRNNEGNKTSKTVKMDRENDDKSRDNDRKDMRSELKDRDESIHISLQSREGSLNDQTNDDSSNDNNNNNNNSDATSDRHKDKDTDEGKNKCKNKSKDKDEDNGGNSISNDKGSGDNDPDKGLCARGKLGLYATTIGSISGASCLNKYPYLFSAAVFDSGVFDLIRYQEMDPVPNLGSDSSPDSISKQSIHKSAPSSPAISASSPLPSSSSSSSSSATSTAFISASTYAASPASKESEMMATDFINISKTKQGDVIEAKSLQNNKEPCLGAIQAERENNLESVNSISLSPIDLSIPLSSSSSGDLSPNLHSPYPHFQSEQEQEPEPHALKDLNPHLGAGSTYLDPDDFPSTRPPQTPHLLSPLPSSSTLRLPSHSINPPSSSAARLQLAPVKSSVVSTSFSSSSSSSIPANRHNSSFSSLSVPPATTPLQSQGEVPTMGGQIHNADRGMYSKSECFSADDDFDSISNLDVLKELGSSKHQVQYRRGIHKLLSKEDRDDDDTDDDDGDDDDEEEKEEEKIREQRFDHFTTINSNSFPVSSSAGRKVSASSFSNVEVEEEIETFEVAEAESREPRNEEVCKPIEYNHTSKEYDEHSTERSFSSDKNQNCQREVDGGSSSSSNSSFYNADEADGIVKVAERVEMFVKMTEDNSRKPGIKKESEYDKAKEEENEKEKEEENNGIRERGNDIIRERCRIRESESDRRTRHAWFPAIGSHLVSSADCSSLLLLSPLHVLVRMQGQGQGQEDGQGQGQHKHGVIMRTSSSSSSSDSHSSSSAVANEVNDLLIRSIKEEASSTEARTQTQTQTQRDRSVQKEEYTESQMRLKSGRGRESEREMDNYSSLYPAVLLVASTSP